MPSSSSNPPLEPLSDAQELERIQKDLRVHLDTWQSFGIEKLETKIPEQGGLASWDELKKTALKCQKCSGLASTRTQVVFGTGNVNADLVFVGEAPGFDEDREGEPFVGKAGQLLTKIIQAMGFKREDVYICNVLKCRPPQNRNPLPEEVTNCKPYLIRQLELIKPKVLVGLGKFAVQTLLETETPISRLRGKFVEYRGIPLMPTFHPAYLLRNEADKKLVWEDMKQVVALLKTADSRQ